MRICDVSIRSLVRTGGIRLRVVVAGLVVLGMFSGSAVAPARSLRSRWRGGLGSQLRVSHAPDGLPAGVGQALDTPTLSAGISLRQARPIDSGIVVARQNDFGDSVAISGSTAIVGADGLESNTGAAYVFVRSGRVWSRQATLSAPDAARQDEFGYSVAISGSTAIVGAANKNLCESPVGAGSSRVCWGAGAAYVFVRSGQVWSEQAELLGTQLPGIVNGFGASVAISGSTALIGTDGGAAYVFVRTGTAWSEQTQLTATSTTASGYGVAASVAISRSTAIVGTPSKNGGKGTAYVFSLSTRGWSLQAKLSASDAGADDYFGASVAISGSIAVVGAPGTIFQNSSGDKAYVFARSGNVWSERVKLNSAGAAGGDGFGGSVAISGKTAMLPLPSNGTVRVFVRSAGGWPLRVKLAASGIEPGDGVAIDGSTAIIGASEKTFAAGAAYVFVRSRSGWTRQADLTAARRRTSP
jgi:FG-GAP repeat